MQSPLLLLLLLHSYPTTHPNESFGPLLKLMTTDFLPTQCETCGHPLGTRPCQHRSTVVVAARTGLRSGVPHPAAQRTAPADQAQQGRRHVRGRPADAGARRATGQSERHAGRHSERLPRPAARQQHDDGSQAGRRRRQHKHQWRRDGKATSGCGGVSDSDDDDAND